MTALSIARKGKGLKGLIARSITIGRRYGLTPGKMDRTLAHFTRILQEYECGATFPITCAALVRNRHIVEKYRVRNIEYAVHGFVHVDHSSLVYERLRADLEKARRVFNEAGLSAEGFRAPYLRADAETLRAVKDTGFSYDSSLSVVLPPSSLEETERYQTALRFYGALAYCDRLALPHLENGLIRFPYCLPDDESLIERLSFQTEEALDRPWLDFLSLTHRSGELFTLGLHPERIFECERPLRNTLEAARGFSPQIWIARLDEIARWWAARAGAQVLVSDKGGGITEVRISGPPGLRLLVRGGEVLTPTSHWDGLERIAAGQQLLVQSEKSPIIGISPTSPGAVAEFLSHQGYLFETAEPNRKYALRISRERFEMRDQRPLIAEIEESQGPLVRLSRWPDGAKSALSITGDIDALTLWDYALRFAGY